MASSRAASLGQLALRARLVPADELRRLEAFIRERVRAGRPVSMGRLLLRGGLTSKGLRRLLRSGADLEAVACDACGAEHPQERFSSRAEWPCRECGALLLGFAIFRKGALRKRAASSAPRSEPARAASSTTQRFHEVVPIPRAPDPQQERSEAPLPLDAVPPVPVISTAGEDTTLGYENPLGSTVHFRKVIGPPPGEASPAHEEEDDYVYELPSGVGRLSDLEATLAFSELVEGSEDAPHAPALPGVANRELAGTHDNGASMIRQLGLGSIGPFVLVEPLGKGAVGRVFLARHEETGQRVALKVLRSEASRDPEVVRRFEREVELSGLVRHPNVVERVDAGVTPDGRRYLALEYLDGGSLLDLLREEDRLDPPQALAIVRGVCLALEAARAHGVVHRDIKPENILFGPDGLPKLADLGLAKLLEDSAAQITETGFVVGTPCYIAPEQAAGHQDVDIRADLFSLGFCLWQMLTGVVPFSDDLDAKPMDVLLRHLEEDLPDPRLYRPDLSDGCAQIVRGLTARERERRYPTPLHVVRDIDLCLAGQQPLGAGAAELPSTLREVAGPSAAGRGEKPSPPEPGDRARARLARTVETPPPPAHEAAPSPRVETAGLGSLALALGLLALAAFGAAALFVLFAPTG